MRALVLDGSEVRLQTDYAEPVAGTGETIVRVLRAGICETDLQLLQGYMGFQGVLGHEFVGVAETGPLAGKRVVGEINCACDDCPTCAAGLRTHCPKRTVIGILNHDGAFADRLVVPDINLHQVPESVSTDAATLVEPLAAAFQIPAQLEFTGEERVVVLGDGRLGNLCAQVLDTLGCRVTVVGKHREKLERLERLGIAGALLDEYAAKRAADVVVDCTGSPSGLPTACELVRPRGTIVLKTTVAGEQTLALAPLVIDEIRVVGSRCGPFDKAIDALEQGAIDVESLITARFSLDDAEAALKTARQSDQLKVLLDISE